MSGLNNPCGTIYYQSKNPGDRIAGVITSRTIVSDQPVTFGSDPEVETFDAGSPSCR
jgi:hypothetical protein